jgi:hypothetical protein
VGIRKNAALTREALDSANARAASWTASPDRQEFLAQYVNNTGYVISSYERGVVVLARKSKDMARAIGEIAESVALSGNTWQVGSVGGRNRPATSVTDPRRTRAGG